MDKIGHLVVTKSLTGNMHKTHKAALLLGSILPDLFVYTYLEGHTWEATFDKIINHMEVLEEKGRGKDCVIFSLFATDKTPEKYRSLKQFCFLFYTFQGFYLF